MEKNTPKNPMYERLATELKKLAEFIRTSNVSDGRFRMTAEGLLCPDGTLITDPEEIHLKFATTYFVIGWGSHGDALMEYLKRPEPAPTPEHEHTLS